LVESEQAWADLMEKLEPLAELSELAEWSSVVDVAPKVVENLRKCPHFLLLVVPVCVQLILNEPPGAPVVLHRFDQHSLVLGPL
jgi:hypothetical protein